MKPPTIKRQPNNYQSSNPPSQQKTQTHNTDMNCLQNCSSWSVNIKVIERGNVDYIKVNSDCNGKNYFLNKLLLNYATLLSNFNFFKYSPSFLDFFFVKSLEQNKDKIEFIRVKPVFPINFNIFSISEFEKDSFKFFVDFDISKKNILQTLNEEILNQSFEFSFNSKIHGTSFFTDHLVIILEGSDLVLLIQNRLNNIISKQEPGNLDVNANDVYCNLVYNENFNLGIFLRVGDPKSCNVFASKITITKFTFEINIPLCIIRGEPYLSQCTELTNEFGQNKSNIQVIEEVSPEEEVGNQNRKRRVKGKLSIELCNLNTSQISFSESNSIRNQNSLPYQFSSSLLSKDNSNTNSLTNFNKFETRDNAYSIYNQNRKEVVLDTQIPVQNNSKAGNSNNNAMSIRQAHNYSSATNMPSLKHDLNYSNSFSSINSGAGMMKGNPTQMGGGMNYNFNYLNEGIMQNQGYSFGLYNTQNQQMHYKPINHPPKNNKKMAYPTSGQPDSSIVLSPQHPVLNNFQQFMTNTTPIIDENDNLTLKKFFNSFDEASLFGIDCFFKKPLSNTTNDTSNGPNKKSTFNLNYYPTLSALWIESSSGVMNISYDKLNCSRGAYNENFATPQYSINQPKTANLLSVNPSTNNLNNDSTSIINTPIQKPVSINNSNILNNLNSPNYETLSHNLSTSSLESYFSIEDIPKVKHQRNVSGTTSKLTYFEEINYYNRSNLKSKLNELVKSNPEIDFMTLNDISSKSWFALLWTPRATTYGSTEVSFLVFYRFRQKYPTGSLKTLPVIGVMANKIDEENQLFWFGKRL